MQGDELARSTQRLIQMLRPEAVGTAAQTAITWLKPPLKLPETAGDGQAVELHEAVAVLGFDPGDQAECDVLDGDVVVAADDVDLAVESQARTRVGVAEHSVDSGAAGAEGAHHLLENHRVIPPRRTKRRR